MKRWLKRIVVTLVVTQVAYLGVVNAVLNHPATQDVINRIQPEKFRFRWEQAWSWYPFRLHVINFNGNFQSWSQQWEISVAEANGTLAIAPLLQETLQVYDMDGDSVDLRFRPRPTPDRDDANIRQFYPKIEGRNPHLPAEPTPTQEPGMKLVFEIDRLGGQNTIWIGAIKTELEGRASATITQQTRHGPLSISDFRADLAVNDLTVDGQQVADSGTIKGVFDLEPIIFYENRGLKALSFLSADADIALPIDGLDFLNFYFKPATGMTVAGTGAINGRLIFDKGDLQPGADIAIASTGLTVAYRPFVIDGVAELMVKVTDTTPDILNAAFRFNSLSVKDQSDDASLFKGKGLALAIDRSSYVLPRDGDFGRKRVAFDIPSMTVPDLAAYQRFLPSKWNVELIGGTGSIEGTAEVTPFTFAADLMLRSDRAELRFKENESFETDLSVILKAAGEASDISASLDIAGSSISLDDTEIKRSDSNILEAWKADLTVSKGKVEFSLPEESGDGRRGLQKLIQEKDIQELLSTLDGHFAAKLVISDLDWASAFFKNPYSPLAFRSSAEIDTDLTIRAGYLAEGSKLQMPPQDFALEILDYVAAGSGGFDITVEKGGEAPDLHLEANLTDASFRRQDEDKAVIDSMTLTVAADSKSVSLRDGGSVSAVNLSIPSAKVNDMTAYNAFLPSGSPVRILGGAADLSAKLDMQEDSASGFAKFKTSRIETDIIGERISGTLGVDVKINGGSAKDKAFDISGSSLILDDLRAPGTQRGWNARIDLGRTEVVWSTPAKLDASGSIYMTDTRPLIDIFFDARGKANKLVDRVLNLKNVRGNAKIKVEPDEVAIPYALVTSDTIALGAKGLISEKNREGMFYAKCGPIAGVFALDDGKRRFGLINATRKFEEYSPGGPMPRLLGLGSRKSKGAGSSKNRLSIFKPKK